jgi:hypothetical protein
MPADVYLECIAKRAAPAIEDDSKGKQHGWFPPRPGIVDEAGGHEHSGIGRNLKVLKALAEYENSSVIAATSSVAAAVGPVTGKFYGLVNGDQSGPGQWIVISPDGTVSPYSQPYSYLKSK